MSNTNQTKRVQLKFDVPVEVKERFQQVSAETGFSMTQILCMLAKYYLSTLDVEHDVRRMLRQVTSAKKEELKLSKRQKRIIENANVSDKFTKDLI